METDDIPFDTIGDTGMYDEDPPPPRRKSGTWRTAKGQEIAFVDMEHSHLLNTIAWVERQFRSLQDTFCDGALDIDLIYPAHSGLVAEARRRRLIPRGKNRMVTP
jgi:hypothetical protein